MPFRYFRENTAEERVDSFAERIDRAGLLSYFHDSHPQRQHARQTKGEFETRFGTIESGIEDSRKNIHIPVANCLNQTH